MSERSSFVTEYIYCAGCLEKLKAALLRQEKFLTAIQIPAGDGFLPIIAGKIGSWGPMMEFETLMDSFNKENAPCHHVRICILHDDGDSTVYIISPYGWVDDLGGIPASELKRFVKDTSGTGDLKGGDV